MWSIQSEKDCFRFDRKFSITQGRFEPSGRKDLVPPGGDGFLIISLLSTIFFTEFAIRFLNHVAIVNLISSSGRFANIDFLGPNLKTGSNDFFL